MENELVDYSGDFDPNAKFKDFSRETLAKYCNAMWLIFLASGEVWRDVVAHKSGPEVSRECYLSAWVKLAPSQVPLMRRVLNITGEDVASFLKMMQMGLGFSLGHFDIKWELKNPNHGIMTVNRCAGLELFEREQPTLVKWLCQDVEAAAIDEYIRCFNPNIKVTALKIPPRKSPDEIPCQWEFTLGK